MPQPGDVPSRSRPPKTLSWTCLSRLSKVWTSRSAGNSCGNSFARLRRSTFPNPQSNELLGTNTPAAARTFRTPRQESLADDRHGRRLSSANFLRVPILMEYEEFKKLQINAATDRADRSLQPPALRRILRQGTESRQTLRPALAIVILDLHQLKEVNDRYGHLRGDQVLQLAATTLRRTLRASDFAFRIGGDEFALLLPQTDPEQAVTLCRRVRAQYESRGAAAATRCRRDARFWRSRASAGWRSEKRAYWASPTSASIN